MKTVDKPKIKKEKRYRITLDQYIQIRRDKRAKQEIKALVLMLFDKVKNWK